MRKKHLTVFALIMLTLCLFTGCLFNVPLDHLKKIEGDIEWDFRAGTDASKLRATVDTDVTFDKDEFVKLYNADKKYDPAFYQYHLNTLDLKINREEQPEEYAKITAGEVNVTVYFDGLQRNVSVYRYESKLYFFILCMGGGAKPEEMGYYYDLVPEKLAEYWMPIVDQVLEDKAKSDTVVERD